MTPSIENYQSLVEVYNSSNSRVYRAVDKNRGCKVILKILNQEYPSPRQLSQFRREYEITKKLKDVSGVLKVTGLIEFDNTLAIVEEDIDGTSLSSQINKTGLALIPALKLAIRISKIIEQLHQHNVVHKDINPSNIIWNPETDEIRIIDFGMASLLSHEYHEFQNLNQLEGTLAYISPEQTGRVNRMLDYRSDLYSLGVTLFELFTGALPFSGKEKIELVHAHIAQKPVKPNKLNASISPSLSAVILKLLEKTADRRYQSCAGLIYDLERCLQQLELQEFDVFSLGEKDRSLHFQIPQRLYGREKEVNTILEAFERVSQGGRELLMVSGVSGTGKSALVHEVHLPLTERRGFFVTGKFDQYQRDVPFFAWKIALEELVALLLKENDQALEHWKSLIQKALGKIGKVLSDVVPSIELIIGEQPDVPELHGEQALNRFNYAFKAFIKTISKQEHPLVIFIDDWQWADVSSMTLLKQLLAEQDNHYLLVIGAYRDNEVDGTHPFELTLNEIQHSTGILKNIRLQNLNRDELKALVSDALLNPPGIDQLVDLVYEKTQGNAFFVIQFLKNLYKEELVRFDPELGCWMWDQGDIEAKDITDNVVCLMADKIQRFSAETQNALKFAACIGNRFDLHTLSILLDKDRYEVAKCLDDALQEGIVRPLGLDYRLASIKGGETESSYQYVHDRVQQAAYGLIDQQTREQVHLNIGNTMLEKLNAAEQKKRLFDIVNHFNAGKPAITEQKQKDVLYRLNVQAGNKAKRSTAYQPALHYFSNALDLLNEDCWRIEYENTVALYLAAAEVAALCKQYSKMENWLKTFYGHVRNKLDKAKAHEIRLQAYTAQNRLSDAVDISLEALSFLGISISKSPNNFNVLSGLLKTKKVLKGKSLDDLFSLPPMQDEEKLVAMNLLGLTIPPAYWTSQELVALIVFQMTRDSVNYGYSAISGYGYSWWGITECAVLGNIDSGYAFGELGVSIAKDHKLQLHQPLFFFGWIIKQFKHHIKESIDVLLEAYQLSLEKGDFEYASYALNNYIQAEFHCGKPLEILLPKMQQVRSDLEVFQIGSSLYWHNIWWQTALNFSEDTSEPTILEGRAYSESTSLPQHQKVNDVSTMFLKYCSKLMLSCFFRDVENGLKYAREARKYLKGGAGMYAFILFHFYESLVLLASLENRSDGFHTKTLLRVYSNQRKLKKWASHSPENHLHRWNLVQAELLRLTSRLRKSRLDKALVYYERALDLVRENGFLHEEALVNELTADYFGDRKQQRLQLIYLKQAHYLYGQWGADNKLANFERRYYKLLPLIRQHIEKSTALSQQSTPMLTSRFGSSSQNPTECLDITSIIKASQAISREIVFEDLVKILMSIAIENAGAQKGMLLNIIDDQISIEAIGEVKSGEIRITTDSSDITSSSCATYPSSIIYYVSRKLEALVIADANKDTRFSQDPYLLNNTPISVLCEPILSKGKLMGIVYLENNLTDNAFTQERLEVLYILTSQAAISIENARLYSQLEDKVAERTSKLEIALESQEQLNELLLNNSSELKDAHTRLHEANLQLKKLANTDGLTNLANRRFFDERLEYEINRCSREEQSLSLLMCDVDHFKAFNDTYGHVDGDECLKQVANQFQNIFHRATDLPARFGGEEFSVILPGIDTDSAKELAEQLRQAVESLNIPHSSSNGFDVLTISVGCYSLVPATGDRPKDIIDHADKALYEAKKLGRNRVCAELSSSVV